VVLQPFPVRHVIEDAGYGADFCVRTGHRMNQKTQGYSTHVDHLELHETYFILSRTLFTIKPGIYLPYFGDRREIDMYIHADGIVKVTGGPIQTDVVPVLRDF
jgi:Xaa-Pro dipeptidase